MVAACSSAETGVGPSIASGSQMCSGNCADLPMHREEEQQRHRAGDRDGGAVHSKLPVVRNSTMSPTTRPMSASFVIQKAFTAARAALRLLPPEADEQVARRGPTSSQPMKSWSRFGASTSVFIAKRNSDW